MPMRTPTCKTLSSFLYWSVWCALLAVGRISSAQLAVGSPEEVLLQGQRFSSASNAAYRFFFQTIVGHDYPVQSSIDMRNWTLLTNVVGNGDLLWIDDPDASGFQHRFYHV